MQVWRLIAHHEDADRAILWSKQMSRIAIGWGKIGDLRKVGPESAEYLSSLIRVAYPKLDNAHLGGPSLFRFHEQMRIGDLVIVGDGRRRRLVMEVTGDYEWVGDQPQLRLGDYHHQRKAKICAAEVPDELWQRCGASAASGESIRWPLARLVTRR